MSASISSTTVRNKLSSTGNNLRGSQQSIDITKDELTRIGDALKNQEFRKLFLDYCEEIQDPVNRQRYEDEIKQFEAERGVEVRFIKPDPGFVIKTSIDGTKKCFVNVAKSAEVERPISRPSFDVDTGARGLNWAIPMAQARPRDDLDAHGKLCRVFDVVFHPDALYLSQRNAAFRKCLIDTALDAVEREFEVQLDHTNLKFPKMEFKGIARATVIRRLAKDPPAEASEPHPLESIYPPKPTAESGKLKVLPVQMQSTSSKCPQFTEPKYVIKHRHGIDLSEFTEELDAKLNMTVPKELVVEIELPLLQSSAECQLDVTVKTIYLLSEKPGARYRLKLDLPYAVNHKDGTANFDADKRRLCITLPVLQQSAEQQRAMHDKIIHLSREDSGVESDVRDSNSGEEIISDNGVLEERKKENEVRTKSEDEVFDCSKDRDSSSKPTPAKINPATFLKSSLTYHFPKKFDCNVLDNVMSLVLHVRNVQSESISSIQTEKSIHIQFTSIGAGYYPTHYAFFLKLPSGTDFQIESFSAEAWENNLVLNLNMAAPIENINSYLAGIDSNDLKEYAVQGKFQVLHGSRQRKKSPSPLIPQKVPFVPLDVCVKHSECEKGIEINIKSKVSYQLSSSVCTTNDDEEAHRQRKKIGRKQKRKNKKRRSLSETAYDDIKAYHKTRVEFEKSHSTENDEKEENAIESPFNGTAIDPVYKNSEKASTFMDVPAISQQRMKQRSYSESRDSVASSSNGTASYKGILKHYSRYDPRPSISGSNSSIDDCCSYSCSTDPAITGSLRFSQSFSDIPEENSSSVLSESCKKTVRFNEVIKKQVFRLDSSILGQRKKNQKRRIQKQRAFQRRLSEGDSVDYEELKRVSSNENELIYFHHSNINNSNKKFNDNRKTSMNKSSTSRPHLESEPSSDIDNKNSMMFEMDM